MWNKAELWRALVARLKKDREVLIAAQRSSVEGVTHDDARPESDKDTRKTEMSYLARGQAKRVEQLTEDIARVGAMTPRPFSPNDRIGAGAIVTLEDEDGACRTVLVAPAGGGIELTQDGQSLRVVTPSAPLGRAIIGLTAGDDAIIERAGSTEELVVLDVR